MCIDRSCIGMMVSIPCKQSTWCGTSIVLCASILISSSSLLQMTTGLPCQTHIYFNLHTLLTRLKITYNAFSKICITKKKSNKKNGFIPCPSLKARQTANSCLLYLYARLIHSRHITHTVFKQLTCRAMTCCSAFMHFCAIKASQHWYIGSTNIQENFTQNIQALTHNRNKACLNKYIKMPLNCNCMQLF